MSRLILVAASLGLLSSVPMAVFNGFHLLSLIVMGFAAYAVGIHGAEVQPATYSRWDQRDGLPHVHGDRRA